MDFINRSQACIGSYTTAAIECRHLNTEYYNFEPDLEMHYPPSIRALTKHHDTDGLFDKNILEILKKDHKFSYNFTKIENKDPVSPRIWEKLIERF